MQDFEIPQSVRTYFSDKRVRSIVNALLENLNGTSPGTSRQDFLDYNQGILLAVQFRTDLVAMLFEIWARVYGHKGLIDSHDLVEDFEYGELDIEDVSDDRSGRTYFRKRGPLDKGKTMLAEVDMDDDQLRLHSCAIVVKSDLVSLGDRNAQERMQDAGWRIAEGDGKDRYYTLDACSWEDFAAAPAANLSRMADAARAMFDARLLD